MRRGYRSAVRRAAARFRSVPSRISILAFVLSAPVIGSASPLPAQPAPLDTASLATGRYASMEMLFERTIFKVDVLTLHVRFSPEVARRLESLAKGRDYSDELADSVASVALEARDVWVEIEFQRGVSLGQFVDGVRENLEKARDAGIIAPGTYEMISENLPRWFGFLEERRVHDGDRILYRIRGDTLRTVFLGADGRMLLDQTDIGAERRLAVLGSYFAPGSSFREDLIRSLFERD